MSMSISDQSPSRKERFEFRITRELLTKVEAQAGREGVSRAEIVTRAVEAYLASSGDLIGKIEKLKTMLREKNQAGSKGSAHEQT